MKRRKLERSTGLIVTGSCTEQWNTWTTARKSMDTRHSACCVSSPFVSTSQASNVYLAKHLRAIDSHRSGLPRLVAYCSRWPSRSAKGIQGELPTCDLDILSA